MSNGIIMGNVLAMGVATLTLSPVSVAANTTAEQTFSMSGLGTIHYTIMGVSKATTQAGLGIVNYRVSAQDTVAITFANNTASPIVPTAGEDYKVSWVRTDSRQVGVSQ